MRLPRAAFALGGGAGRRPGLAATAGSRRRPGSSSKPMPGRAGAGGLGRPAGGPDPGPGPRVLRPEPRATPGQAWELRLLPKPLYRYESTDPEVLDGAVFALVSSAGTDPEIILLIEARKTPEGPRWVFGARPVLRHEPLAQAQGPGRLDARSVGPENTFDQRPHPPLPLLSRPDHPAESRRRPPAATEPRRPRRNP